MGNRLRSSSPREQIATAAAASENVVRAPGPKALHLRSAPRVRCVATPALAAVVLALTGASNRARIGATVLRARVQICLRSKHPTRAGRAREKKKQPESPDNPTSFHADVRDDGISPASREAALRSKPRS